VTRPVRIATSEWREAEHVGDRPEVSLANGDLEVEESQEYGNATDRVVTYVYDLSGRLKSMEYPSGLTLTYAYDDLGRGTAVNDGANDRVADTWKGHLLEKREYANGTYLTHLDDNSQNLSGYGYDEFGRIANHRWKDSGGTLIAGWSHDYDRLGNKKYQEDLKDSTESELYGYDSVYRLDEFDRGQLNQAKDEISSPSRTQTWTLDDLGNWDNTVLDSVTETRVHSDVNELTQRTVGEDPAITLSYDDAGNLSQDGSADGDHKCVYDYRNRLIGVQEYQTDTWNDTAEMKYDAVGRRLLRVVTNKGSLNGTTRFIWGGDPAWQCLEERDSSDDLVARFIYAPGYIDDLAVQERDLNSDEDFGDDDEIVYYHQNTLFSVYALSDADESVVERYRYNAYGSSTVLDADFSDDADGLSDVDSPYVFTGRRLDAESGLMQYRNRCYSSLLGRFISRDPLQYADSFNSFTYARANPVLGLDPFGLWTREDAAQQCLEGCYAFCWNSYPAWWQGAHLMACMGQCRRTCRNIHGVTVGMPAFVIRVGFSGSIAFYQAIGGGLGGIFGKLEASVTLGTCCRGGKVANYTKWTGSITIGVYAGEPGLRIRSTFPIVKNLGTCPTPSTISCRGTFQVSARAGPLSASCTWTYGSGWSCGAGLRIWRADFVSVRVTVGGGVTCSRTEVW